MRWLALLLACGLLGASASGQQSHDFSSVRAAAAALPQLHAIAISHENKRVFEYYAPKYTPTRLANVKSVSKSIIAALVGIAIERKLIRGIDEPIVRWFPELKKDSDPRKQAITIGHLLTMQSGLESTSGGNYGSWVSSRNWVRSALERPMVSDPGTSMEYSTGTSHILSAILTKVTKRNTWQFAQEALGKPLGISFARWPRDPQGIYFGGNEMLMTPRQMIEFGELWLNRGRAGKQQVVSEAWVEASCRPVTRSRWDNDREYGRGWWIQDFAGHRACFAWGYGGQYIFVFRDLDLVIAITSSSTLSEDRWGYRRQLFNLLEQHILPGAALR